MAVPYGFSMIEVATHVIGLVSFGGGSESFSNAAFGMIVYSFTNDCNDIRNMRERNRLLSHTYSGMSPRLM
jgi:ribose/xylose/arabinose/galactoside ABC-type transport system permease subunit